MRYLVIERFRDGPGRVYERLAERGRMLPPGLRYLDSWIDAERLDRCFQLMETDDPELFDTWLAHWADVADCEVIPVITSAEAASRSGSDEAQAAVDGEDLPGDVAGLVGEEEHGGGRDLPG